MMRARFLKSAGPSAPDNASRTAVHCGIFSLTPADGVSLARLDPARCPGALQSLVDAKRARVLGWQGVTVSHPKGMTSKYEIEAPTGAGGKVLRYGNLLVPEKVALHTLGGSLTISSRADSDKLGVGLLFDVLQPAAPSLAELEAAACGGSTLPAFEPVKINVYSEAAKDSGARLEFLQPFKLPPGHPERGRQHVVVTSFHGTKP